MLTTAVVFALLVAAPGHTVHSSDTVPQLGCDTFDVITHKCDGGDDDELEIGDGGEGQNPPPAPDPAPNPAPDPAPNPGPGGPGDEGEDAGPGDDDGGWNCLDGDGIPVGPECAEDEPDEPPEEEPEEIPDVHWYDVESFAPHATPPAIEPFGAAIARAPMNVAVSASAHTVGGELFGHPMAVTFTPDYFTIDYGDGSVVEVTESAPTWEQLGQEQLTPTATSHTYEERGTATVTVDVAYSATVDFGALGVYPVLGHIVSRGAPVDVRIYEKQSYLVDATCEEDPSAPGC